MFQGLSIQYKPELNAGDGLVRMIHDVGNIASTVVTTGIISKATRKGGLLTWLISNLHTHPPIDALITEMRGCWICQIWGGL